MANPGQEGGNPPIMTKPRQERRLRVRAIRRNQPDLRKLSRALIELAQAQAEADAAAEHPTASSTRKPATPPSDHTPEAA